MTAATIETIEYGPVKDHTRQVLILAGVVELGVGLLHFAMPTFYRRSAGLHDLSKVEDDYVVLVTYAVGILLLAFGTFTIMLARSLLRHLEILQHYLFVTCGLWAGRVLLEIIYPVRLRMFGIEPFTAVVMPGVVAELLLFVYAAYRVKNLRRRVAR